MSNELDNLQKKLAQYETVFRGKEVRVGEYWTAGNTVEVYDHDEGAPSRGWRDRLVRGR